MILDLYRKWKKRNYTIGQLYIDNEYFCDTLEDTDRNLSKYDPIEKIMSTKVYGETAIPYGTYFVSLTWSPKYNRVLPLINNVPGFEGIRIHSGNTNKDTLGCILVGVNKEKGKVLESRKTFNDLFNKLQRDPNIVINIHG